MSEHRWLALLVLTSFGGTGCFSPVDTAWSVSFESMADDTQAEFVFTEVRRAIGVPDCPEEEDDVIRGPYRIRPAGPIETIAELNDDTYCFVATAVRDDCTIVAEGFVEVDLPTSRDVIEIVLRTSSGGGCEPGETCVQGRCIEEAVTPTCLPGMAYCAAGGVCCSGADMTSACLTYTTAPGSCREPE